MEQPAQRAWLEGATGQEIKLTENFTVGRNPANTLAIQDGEKRVSSYHARIERDETGLFYVEDRHSTNGTFVNDRKVTRRQLTDGDRIRFGSNAVYTFRQPEAASHENFDDLGVTSRHFEERICWLVIGDVKGSSELVRRMDGEAFARLVSDWAARCRDIAEKSGGVMANRTGDGWLLLWEERANVVEEVATTLRGFREMQRQGQPDFRVLIHRGRVTLGGGVKAGEDNVLSMELHRAFRMEKIAAKLGQGMVVSAEAMELLRTVMPCYDLPGEFELPGFAGVHRFYSVG